MGHLVRTESRLQFFGSVGTCNRFKHVVLLASDFVHVVAATVERDEVQDVAAEANDRSHQHDKAVDFVGGRNYSIYRLDEQPHQKTPNDEDGG